VVLLPESTFEQWFEPDLTPWIHYVPLWEKRAEDIINRLLFLEANPRITESLSRNARTFACTHLTFEGRTCWWLHMAQVSRRHLFTYDVDDALVKKRMTQVTLVQISKENLVCKEVFGGPHCVWAAAATERN